SPVALLIENMRPSRETEMTLSFHSATPRLLMPQQATSAAQARSTPGSMLGLTYPYDWGFIPSTKGEDGDPLDALVLHDVATAPGLVLKCKIIVVLEVVQTEGGKHPIRNDRLIAVPRHSRREQADHDARDLPKSVRS